MPERTTIDLIRHGEPVGGDRYRGRIDDPLSELGRRQMWRSLGRDWPWSKIITSPLQRCRSFAEELGRRDGIPVEQDARIKEVGYGRWEGYTAAELLRKDPATFSRFHYDPVANRPDDAEPLSSFLSRVRTALRDISEQNRGTTLLLVTHAGVIRAAIAEVLAVPSQRMYRIQVQYAGITRIRFDSDRPPAVLGQNVSFADRPAETAACPMG